MGAAVDLPGAAAGQAGEPSLSVAAVDRHDDAARLGELQQLRQAMTLLRGYGVRVWSFWQDLSQLRHLYPNDWKTILNNCRIQQYFGTTTARAADAVVDVSGFGPRESILDLERDEIVLNVAGDEPVIARKPNYRFDTPF